MTEKTCLSSRTSTSDSEKSSGRMIDEELCEWEDYSGLKIPARKRVIPCMEIILSRHCIDSNNPGYQKPAIRVLTLFSSGKAEFRKPNSTDDAKMERHRNLNKEFRVPSFNPPPQESQCPYQ